MKYLIIYAVGLIFGAIVANSALQHINEIKMVKTRGVITNEFSVDNCEMIDSILYCDLSSKIHVNYFTYDN